MTPEEQIAKMKKAITQAVKVMGDRFGSTEGDVEVAESVPLAWTPSTHQQPSQHLLPSTLTYLPSPSRPE